MTTPVFDEPMYSLAIYPGTTYWYHITAQQRQVGQAGGTQPDYKHYLPPGSYMISGIVTGDSGINLVLNPSGGGNAIRTINLTPVGTNGTTRSGTTTISVTTTGSSISFAPTGSFSQAQLDAPVTATAQIIKIPSYIPPPPE